MSHSQLVHLEDSLSLTTGRQGHDKAILNGLQSNEQVRSSQDFNLGLLNSGQVLLPTEPWTSSIAAEDRWHPWTQFHSQAWIYCTEGTETFE